MKLKFYLYLGLLFSEDAARRKEEVKYINAHYTGIENTLVDLTKKPIYGAFPAPHKKIKGKHY